MNPETNPYIPAAGSRPPVLAGREDELDTFTVALVQLQPLMSVAPGPGVLFFAAVVVLTMLAADSFDPRLIWDSANTSEAQYG